MAEKGRSKPKFVPAAKGTTVGKTGEPPALAIATVVGTIIFVLLLYNFPILASWLPFADSDYFWIGLIALPPVAMIAAMVISKTIDYRRAQSWTQTAATIVRSEMTVTHHRFPGEAETVKNAPAVEYEFTAGGRKYHGSRIGIGDDSGGENSAATLARYRKGAQVTVFYDPDDPRNCVLERGGPLADVTFVSGSAAAAQAANVASAAGGAPQKVQVSKRGCLFESAALIAICYGLYWMVTNGVTAIGTNFPKSNPEFVVFATCFGLAVLLFFTGYRRTLKQAQSWPSVQGAIVKSEVTAFTETEKGRTRTKHRAEIEYSYRVGDHDYSSTQLQLGLTSAGSKRSAEKTAGKYREGDTVTVHYDPANPGTAALATSTRPAWLLLGIALALFGVAVFGLGLTK